MNVKSLTSQELCRLSGAAAELYRITNRGELMQKLSLLANDVVDAYHAVAWDIDFASMAQTTSYASAESAAIVQKSWPIYTHFCERYPQFGQAITNHCIKGKVYRATELLPPSFVERIGFMDEYARPNGCEFQVGYFFKQHGSRVAFVNCNRNGRNFTARDVAMMEFLAPHFQAAYENANAFEAKNEALERARAVRDSLPVESLWLDDNLNVQEATPGVAPLIREFFHQPFSTQRLPEKMLKWLRASASLTRPITPLIVRGADALLRMRFYPQRLAGLGLLTLTRCVTTPTLEQLEPLGLTRRESEILLWVSQAKTNDEIGIILGISGLTVKKHVENISAKLGVNSRVALATIPLSDL